MNEYIKKKMNASKWMNTLKKWIKEKLKIIADEKSFKAVRSINWSTLNIFKMLVTRLHSYLNYVIIDFNSSKL